MAVVPRIKIEPYSDFEPGEPGFVVAEHYVDWTGHESYAMPAWDERGYGEALCGVFPTRVAAVQAACDAGLL